METLITTDTQALRSVHVVDWTHPILVDHVEKYRQYLFDTTGVNLPAKFLQDHLYLQPPSLVRQTNEGDLQPPLLVRQTNKVELQE